MRGKTLLALASLVLLALMAGCGGGAQEDAAEEQGTALWNEAQMMKKDLDEKRVELKALIVQQEAADEAAETSGDDATTGDDEAAEEGATEEAAGEAKTPEQLQAEIESLRSEISAETDELYAKIVEYINSAGLVEGVELTPQQREAFKTKAEIDILYAQEYIDRGGDYKRAIDIYSQALMSDPTNETLLAAKAKAEEMRYMDEERFAKVTKGMTRDEVREHLGTVMNNNVREFTERERLGWFYPKDGGGAAGVYFKEKKQGEGEWIVEITDFDAVPSPNANQEQQEDEPEG